MTPTFDLLTQPWLPCVDRRGSMQYYSLMDTIARAHQIRAVQAELPVTTGALYLFLIAFAKAVYDPPDDAAWQTLWRQGAFPEAPLAAYARQWADRFDLFHPEHPFYQDPKFGLREKDQKNMKGGQTPAKKSISGLLLHLASGSNATLFNHALDDRPESYTPAKMARLLIMLQAYSLGGMSSAAISKDKYYKDSAFGRGILFLHTDENLFRTLLLNLIPKDFDPIENSENDCPVWEKADPFLAESMVPGGLMDLLTWQSRRILLAPEVDNSGDVVIRDFYPAPGQALVDTFNNPFYHIRFIESRKGQPATPLRFQEGRSLWRDSAAILNVDSAYAETALPIRWAAHLMSRKLLPRDRINLTLFGMCTEPGQKKAYFYAQETFNAPAAYLQAPLKLADLENGLEQAEAVRKDLYIAVRELARFKLVPQHDLDSGREPGSDDYGPLIQHWDAEPYYWRLVEPAFYRLLTGLPESDEAIETWQEDLRRAAREALSFAAQQAGTDAAGLKARAKAEKTLNIRLNQTFKSTE